MKSITQMFAEEVGHLPRAEYGRPEPGAASRLKAELHLRFWLPIAEMLDPSDSGAYSDRAGKDLYSRGQHPLQPHEMKESFALMASYLGTPNLTFNAWFQLRPIFQQLLKDALAEPHRDLVVNAVREFVRLTLGQPIDAEYGVVHASVGDVDGGRYDLHRLDDERYLFPDESEADFAHWSRIDWNGFLLTQAYRSTFDDAEEFAKDFPHATKHRLNMARALRPVFDRSDTTNWRVGREVPPYIKAVLAIDFREAGFLSKTTGVAA